MKKRILCPFHEEDTPSAVIYPNGWLYCFGCGAKSKVAESTVTKEEEEETSHEAKRALEDQLDYIKGLPVCKARGLRLPADDKAYYIVWPDADYYKRRPFRLGGDEPRYQGAWGVPKPLFKVRLEGAPVLAIVEGEINALSIARSDTFLDVVSPGGVSEFAGKRVNSDLLIYTKYATILIVVDADGPGVKAGIELSSILRSRGIITKIWAMEKDANDVLTENGEESLRQQIRSAMEM